MKSRGITTGAAALIAGVGVLLSQRATPQRPFASLVPAGPLVYAEAKDLATLARDWNASQEKKAWLDSGSFKVFANSRLGNRLEAARQEFAAALTGAVGMPLFESMAGGNSALALYNIGDLQFLFLTRMPSARAYQTALWQSRAKFQPRQASGIDYFVRREGTRTVAFAVTGDLLLAATAEEPLAAALALISGKTPPALAGEAWFQRAIAAEPQPGDVRLAVNLDRTAATPYFRSYWIQRNRTFLKPFQAVLADLDPSAAEFRERRILLRAEATPAPDESVVNELVQLAPASAGLVRVWAAPPPDQALALIADKFFALPPQPADRRETAPLAAALDRAIGSESDIDVRVDEVTSASAANAPSIAPVRALLAANPPLAMMQVDTTRATTDGEFIVTPRALALVGTRAWGALPALADASLVSNGRVLVIANAAEFAQSVLRPAPAAPMPVASYAMRFQMGAELPRITRMMEQIDAPRTAGENAPNPEPLFFSGNLASLGRVLARVRTVSLDSHDQGAIVKQTVTYRLQ